MKDMETYLRSPVSLPIGRLYPDPNNPRLALEDAPGYDDADDLFDENVKERILGELGEDAYGVADLEQAIVGQGWMPIDNILVWMHPDEPDKAVVVEGNRRRLALHRMRTTTLPAAKKKLERMEKKAKTTATHQIEEQREFVRRLEQVAADTDNLQVVPVDADTPEELDRKLPRVLAVRHITGAREWGNYAEDIWLLNRYHQLFRDKHGEAGRFWDDDLIGTVADEASLSKMKTKWQLKSASWFSHFRTEYEDQLPDGEEFTKSDYYLFELIARKPWVRSQLDIGDEAFEIPKNSEEILFKWVFQHPRGRTADDNPNVFYRHENINLWDQIRRYDEDHGTAFAKRLDPENPDEADRMQEVEAAYLSHKAQRKPHAVIDELLKRLSELTAEQLAAEGKAFRAQLKQLREQASKFLKMIDAAES
jgi:hypothetical protein